MTEGKGGEQYRGKIGKFYSRDVKITDVIFLTKVEATAHVRRVAKIVLVLPLLNQYCRAMRIIDAGVAQSVKLAVFRN